MFTSVCMKYDSSYNDTKLLESSKRLTQNGTNESKWQFSAENFSFVTQTSRLTHPPLVTVIPPDALHKPLFVTGLEALDCLAHMQLLKLHQVKQRLQQ